MGVTDEEFAAALSTARNYVLVLLRDGPNPSPANRDDIVREHAKRNVALHRDGVMNVVGPMTTDGEVRGVVIIDGDVAKATEVMEGDPAVQAGIFVYSLHEFMSFPGSTLGV